MAVRMEMLVRPVIAGLVLLVALVGLIGSAIRDPKPHDFKVGLVGPPPAVQQISAAFGANAPGAFDFKTYASETDARTAIDAREVDGALVLGASPRLIVAGAAGDAAVGVITAAFTNVLKAQGATPEVEVVHPFASGDAHGLILFFVVVAVTISTLVTQAVLYLTARTAGLATQFVVVGAYSVLAALTAMGSAAWLADDYASGFWTAVGLVILASAAIGAVVAGAARLLGPAGIALSALVVVLLSLVSSGGPAGSELLPDFYRWLAPYMPAGQLFSALRGAIYFDGAALMGPVIVLSAWLAGGVVLMAIAEAVAGRKRGAAAA